MPAMRTRWIAPWLDGTALHITGAAGTRTSARAALGPRRSDLRHVPGRGEAGHKPESRRSPTLGGMPPHRTPFPTVAAPPRPAPARPPVVPLRIMVAGVDKDARAPVEASVRHALGSQAERGPWSISVVSMAGKWSVTLDGPDDRLRGLSFVADRSRLEDAIREAVQGGGETPVVTGAPSTGAPSPGATSSPSEARDRHPCEHCGKAVLVVYEGRPDEGKVLVAVACPHCWRIGHVEVGAWAAAGGEYRAEKG